MAAAHTAPQAACAAEDGGAKDGEEDGGGGSVKDAESSSDDDDGDDGDDAPLVLVDARIFASELAERIFSIADTPYGDDQARSLTENMELRLRL